MRDLTPETRTARSFLQSLGRPFVGEELFDRVGDTVYFIKDAEARYVVVNDTLMRRCGFATKAALIGRTARDVFAAPLGERFSAQDRRILRDGVSINAELELHLYPGGREGWCLTWKEPLTDRHNAIVGLCGISRDLQQASGLPDDVPAFSAVLDHVRHHIDEPLRLADLAARAHMSVFQFDQRVRALFGLSAGQYLIRARMEHACNRLRRTHDAVSDIALQCGYGDQAAFTRQFRKSVGLTPKAYRVAARMERDMSAPG